MNSLEALVKNHPVLIVAHRGASAEAPENTLTAINRALDIGAPMVEIDVQTTTDDQIVVFHDPSLERTSNGHGELSRCSYAQLNKLDAGSWFSEKFRGEKIPLLADVFHLIRGRGCINVEIKSPAPGEDWRKRLHLITRLTEEEQMITHTLFSSFHHESLKYINAMEKGFHTAALLPGEEKRLPSALLHDTGCQAFVCSLGQLTAELVADIAEHKILTGVYTINTEEDAEIAIQKNAAALITDNPERLIRYLRNRLN